MRGTLASPTRPTPTPTRLPLPILLHPLPLRDLHTPTNRLTRVLQAIHKSRSPFRAVIHLIISTGHLFIVGAATVALAAEGEIAAHGGGHGRLERFLASVGAAVAERFGVEGAGGVGVVKAEGDGRNALALDVEGVGDGVAEGLEAGDGAGVGGWGGAGGGSEGSDGQGGAWGEMGCVGWGERAESEEACTGGENEKKQREDSWVREVHVWERCVLERGATSERGAY